MIPMLDWVTEPLRYEFMRRALVEVVIMGAVTGAIGCYVVLRGLAFMGDALSHAIFPGIALAFLLGRSIFLGALAFGVLTVVLIAIAATNRRVKEDSAIGVLFAGMFALGVVLISSSPHFARDLASFLFGNVLGVTAFDIGLSVVVGVGVLLLLAVFHRALLITSFDRAGAAAMGVPVFWLDLLAPAPHRPDDRGVLERRGEHPRPRDADHAGGGRAAPHRSVARDDGPECGHRRRVGRPRAVLSYHHDLAAGGTIVLVATLAFGIVWLAAPTHGFVATRVWARRRAAGVRSEDATRTESITGPGRPADDRGPVS